MEQIKGLFSRLSAGAVIVGVLVIGCAASADLGMAADSGRSLAQTQPSGTSPPSSASSNSSFTIVAAGVLSEKPRPLKVEPGAGFGLAVAKGDFITKMVVSDRDRPIKELEGVFTDYALVNFDQHDYLIISVFSGGAHCCSSYAVFVKPAGGGAARYVGETGDEEGGAGGVKESLITRNGQLYVQVGFPGFSYFHTSFAGSLLVNVPQIYYQITPGSLVINNVPFKGMYLQGADNTETEILKELAKRRVKPPAILNPTGPGSKALDADFSDDLAQLLVKRTIYYLKAGETKTAWDSFSRDVAKYYKSKRWAKEVYGEVQEILNPKPAPRGSSSTSRSMR